MVLVVMVATGQAASCHSSLCFRGNYLGKVGNGLNWNTA